MSDGLIVPTNSDVDFDVSLAVRQAAHRVDEQQLLAAARSVLQESPFVSADVSLAVVDDPTIHELNRRYLNHDYPTDVLSFVLEDDGSHLTGEVILSADTAARNAPRFGWTPREEQLLYVIHGLLHLVGYNDKSEAESKQMRAAEDKFLQSMGAKRPAIADAAPAAPTHDINHEERAP